eukprot:m.145326 g.145326  ORF g.145326 m.145326 type:complete len:373 (-) comp16217_c0_seq4:1169-2287(-)
MLLAGCFAMLVFLSPMQEASLDKSYLPPTAIGLGAQKAGSTTLFAYMEEFKWMEKGNHGKEIHFFDKLTEHPLNRSTQPAQAQSLYKAYASEWPKASQGLLCTETGSCSMSITGNQTDAFEFTPVYLVDRRIASLMYNVLPHSDTVKLLVLLRDPVERANSGYWQASPRSMTIERATELALEELLVLEQVYNNTLSLNHLEIKGGQMLNPEGCVGGWEQYKRLHAELNNKRIDAQWFGRYLKHLFPQEYEIYKSKEGHIHRGIYVDQIRTYLCAGFRPEQFLILTNGELRDDQIGAMNRIAQFMQRPLSLQHEGMVDRGLHRNSKPHALFSAEVTAQLEAFYKPYNEELVKLLLENNFNINPHYILKELQKY